MGRSDDYYDGGAYDELEAAEISAEEAKEAADEAMFDRLKDEGFTNADIMRGARLENTNMFVVVGGAVYDTATDTITAETPEEFWHRLLDVSDGGGG